MAKFNKYVGAFVDGFLAPIYELIISIILYAALQIVLALKTPTTGSVILDIAIFAIVMVLINIFICFIKGFDDSTYAGLYIIGAICGLVVFGGAISNTSFGSNNSGLFTILYVISSALGIFARVAYEQKRGQSSSDGSYLGDW
jgi:hypothetical protein